MADPVLRLAGASLAYGSRTLWSGLDLQVPAGEFVAVLGANGSGKTSLIRVILGLQPLTAGHLEVAGQPARRGSADIGYVPQQRRADPLTPLRARDFVAQALAGHRWGPGWPSAARRRRVLDALAAVGAAAFAEAPRGGRCAGPRRGGPPRGGGGGPPGPRGPPPPPRRCCSVMSHCCRSTWPA